MSNKPDTALRSERLAFVGKRRFEIANRLVKLLLVLGRDEVENGLERLGFRPKSHRLVKRFKPQLGIMRDIEGKLGGSGF